MPSWALPAAASSGRLPLPLNPLGRLAGARRKHLAQRIEGRVKLFIGHRLDAPNLHVPRHKQGADLHVGCRLRAAQFRSGLTRRLIPASRSMPPCSRLRIRRRRLRACASWRTASCRAAGKTPFAALPSVRNLARGVQGGKHERSRRRVGKGVMPDDHPLSVAAARTLALQNADVVFLMGARFNWIFHFGQPPRYAKDVKVIQLDISPEEIGHNKATEVALVGDGKAIVGQLNQALAGRQWFYPKDTPWRQMITKKADENAAQIRPQIDDDEAPANYFRALRDVAAWMPKNAILSAEGAGTMDIGLTQLPSFSARSCLNAAPTGRWGSASATPSPPASCIPTGRSSTSRATRRSAFRAWRWRRWSVTTSRPRSSS